MLTKITKFPVEVAPHVISVYHADGRSADRAHLLEIGLPHTRP